MGPGAASLVLLCWEGSGLRASPLSLVFGGPWQELLTEACSLAVMSAPPCSALVLGGVSLALPGFSVPEATAPPSPSPHADQVLGEAGFPVHSLREVEGSPSGQQEAGFGPGWSWMAFEGLHVASLMLACEVQVPDHTLVLHPHPHPRSPLPKSSMTGFKDNPVNWRFRCPNLASGLDSLTGRPWASRCPWNRSHLQHKHDSSNAYGAKLWCRVNENQALAV